LLPALGTATVWARSAVPVKRRQQRSEPNELSEQPLRRDPQITATPRLKGGMNRGTAGSVIMTKAPTHKIVDPGRARQPLASAAFATERKRHLFSVLFEDYQDRTADDALRAPCFFVDLNCDQIVDSITANKEEYNLKPFFYAPLRRLDAIRYRHEVMQDLENDRVLELVKSFARSMHEVREYLALARKMHYKEQAQAWFLNAIEVYCEAINVFSNGLCSASIKSRGLLGFRHHLTNYARSARFTSLSSDTKAIRSDLSTVRYCVLINESGFTVRKYDSEIDYSADVAATFDKFKQGAVKDYRSQFSTKNAMNHIEAKIVEFVARLHADIFLQLNDYCARNGDFVDNTIAVFDREIQFYVAYLDYVAILKRSGLQFCYPHICDDRKEVYDYGAFDLALAHKLARESRPVVCNDFELKGKERILVISGPNQGGKTTFARTIGQLHYLTSIGCPIAGKEAQLSLFDQMFTHFEREEKVDNLRGKLEDDLVRIRAILDQATRRSIIIMNEIFTSTTIQDETFLSEKVMEQLSARGPICVWVTFVDELASFGPQTVSMVSTVAPDNPTLRTFQIVRRGADGLAYAMAIAQKHRVTYQAIKGRIKS
jgi:DNA mismatch repair protein MutS